MEHGAWDWLNLALGLFGFVSGGAGIWLTVKAKTDSDLATVAADKRLANLTTLSEALSKEGLSTWFDG